MIPRLLCLLLAAAWLATASSYARNPLQFLGLVEDASIHTNTHQVNALSRFDLQFDCFDHNRRIKLSLEPNHDVISNDLHVNYLASDGSLISKEKVDRSGHKVFKGTAFQQRTDGVWSRVGWARITIVRDGNRPLFEGAFTVNRDPHHIQLQSKYLQVKHELDPIVEARGDEAMIVWRDSDIAPPEVHTDLKRGVIDSQSCYADTLAFNSRTDHPVFHSTLRRSENHWGAMPIGSRFGRRQIDSQPGGNSALVNLTQTIGSTAGCPTTRKVALVGIAADCGYTGYFNGNRTALRLHVINEMNTASQLWESTFQISLGLKDLTIMDQNCPGTQQAATPWNQACSANLDIQGRLNLFSQWRGTVQDSNSHWTLLTECASGTAVGLAWLGQSCVQAATNTNSNGMNETVSGANVVARTPSEWQVIAHETGHTYGAVHDCTSSACMDPDFVRSQQCCPLSSTQCDAGQRYIMNPSSSDSEDGFSPCSVGNVCSAIGNNAIDTSCLTSNKDVVLITQQQCGNGIVEGDEECDCGGASGCGDNQCCDPTTCKFQSGAVCDDSNEDCCNNCQFAAKNTVCRNSTSVCDPVETCPGNSALCPADVTAPNGQACKTDDGVDAQCASGQCTSRDLQCRTIMAGYISGANDTYACDSQTCSLSCASPAFGYNTCYGLQQNFLDGSPCGGGGHCQNGKCEGSTFGGEVSSWINDHKPLVIGIGSGIGAILLFAVLSCLWRCIRGRKRRRAARLKSTGPSPSSSWYGPAPPVPPHGMPPQNYVVAPPPPNPQPSRDMQLQQQAWERAQQQAWESGWRPPQRPSNSNVSTPVMSGARNGRVSPVSPIGTPSPPPGPPNHNGGLYGNGLIGNFSRPVPPPIPPPPPPSYFGSRYA